MKVTVFIMGAVQTALLTLVPVMMEKTQISAVHWSWLLSLGLFLFVFCSPLWGKAIDRFGAKQTLLLSFSMMLVSHCLLLIAIQMGSFAQNVHGMLILLIVARIGYGLSASGVFPSAQTALLQQVPADQPTATVLARLNVVSQLGRLSGPLLVSVIVALFAAPMFSVALLLVLGGVWTIRLFYDFLSNADNQARGLGGVTNDLASDSHISNGEKYRWQNGLSVYALALTLTVFIGALQFLLGPYLKQLWQISAEQASIELGWMLTTAAICSVIFALKIGPKLFHSAGKTMGAVCILLMLGSTLLVLADRSWILHAAVACLSGGVALVTPWYGALLRDKWVQHQGTISGQLASVHMAGYGLGTLVGGYALDFYGVQSILLFAAMPWVALFCFFLIAKQFFYRDSVGENKSI